MTLLIIDVPGGRRRYIIRILFFCRPVWKFKRVSWGHVIHQSLYLVSYMLSRKMPPPAAIDDDSEKEMKGATGEVVKMGWIKILVY